MKKIKKDSNISDIMIQKKTLIISVNIRQGQLDDPKKIAKDVSNIGHRCNGDYQIQVENDKDIVYIMSLIKQAL